MFERIRYFLFRALRNMRQAPFLTTATVLTVAVALTIVAVFAILVLNVQRLGSLWSREVQVVAYLDQVPRAEVLQGWKDRLGRLQPVEEVRFVDREEAYARFLDRLGPDDDLLLGVSPNILPASLEIVLKSGHRNRAGAETVVNFLQGDLGLTDLQYGQAWLEKFETFLLLVRLTGLVLGGILLSSALFIVANTIRLTLFARKDELEIMALVGGTPLFIKTPFLIEGALQGALGGVLSLGSLALFFHGFLREGMHSLFLSPGDFEITFLSGGMQLVLLAGGILLGLFASLVSLRKFVRI